MKNKFYFIHEFVVYLNISGREPILVLADVDDSIDSAARADTLFPGLWKAGENCCDAMREKAEEGGGDRIWMACMDDRPVSP